MVEVRSRVVLACVALASGGQRSHRSTMQQSLAQIKLEEVARLELVCCLLFIFHVLFIFLDFEIELFIAFVVGPCAVE